MDVREEEPATSTKGYVEQMTLEETDSRELISSSESDSSDNGYTKSRTGGVRRRTSKKKHVPLKWWFQHPEVKSNLLIVLGAWFLVFLSIACFCMGVILEILFHAASVDVFRGFILMIIGAVLLVPSGYAVTHIYLAARKVGRVRMDSVWFFR